MSRIVWDNAILKAMGYRMIRHRKDKVYRVKWVWKRVTATGWPLMDVVKCVHHKNGQVSLYLVDVAESHLSDAPGAAVFHVKASTCVHVFDLKTYRDTGFYRA